MNPQRTYVSPLLPVSRSRFQRPPNHKPIAELTSIVRELSQKIDKLEDADEFLSVG